ncbi:unnamed protein product [Clavelina lepadiformis]|uniref:BHLH domain-containing protein n=1 Tax=Clavelina lepadiformis TaxID=159417 RepID=A0ABP0FZJ4_CLALP
MKTNTANNENETKSSYSHNVRHKEKRRTEFINKAFADLRKCIPHVPDDTKLSKIKTLHLASSYIAYLSEILETGVPGDQQTKDFNINFKVHIGNRARKSRNAFFYKDVKTTCITDSSNNTQLDVNQEAHREPSAKRAKGRTGWPETVWAEALENRQSRSDSVLLNCIPSGEFMTKSLTEGNELTFAENAANASNYQFCPTTFYSDAVELAINKHEPLLKIKSSARAFPNLHPEVFITNGGDYSYTESLFSENDFIGPSAFEANHQGKGSFSSFANKGLPANIPGQSITSIELQQNPSATFPLKAYEQSANIRSLPSISTLCYNDKIRVHYEPHLEDLYQDPTVTSDSSDLMSQSPLNVEGQQNEEPNLVELQPVTICGEYSHVSMCNH